MGRAVERLEIWTAGLLLLVAVLVGAAGTLQWMAESPPASTERSAERQLALVVSSDFAGTALARLVGVGRSALAASRNTLARVPGGALGIAAALLGGALAMPLLLAAAGRARRVRGLAGKLARPRRWQPFAPLRIGLRRSGPQAATPALVPPSPSILAPPDPPAAPAPAASPPAAQPLGQPAAAAPEPPSGVEPAEHSSGLVELGRPGWVVSGRWQSQPTGNETDATARAAPKADTGLQPQLAGGSAAAAPHQGDEEHVIVAMRAAQAILNNCDAGCAVLAIDKLSNEAQVLLDLRPGDQAKLDTAFAGGAIEAADAGLRWRAPVIHVSVRRSAAAPAAIPELVVPLLSVGRRRVRFAPLATWRHLGVYGAGAHAAAHHVLTTLLCQQHPDKLGLAVLDRHGWAALYRGAPHWVDTPGDGPTTADTLARALRNGAVSSSRPLLLVLVDPDGATLSAFGALFGRLSVQPTAPLHLLLVQSRLQPLGRHLYLMLPALVTAGSAAPELLPAVRQWPRSGSATVLVRGRRWIGRPLLYDEAAAGELTRRLARFPRSTVPVLWSAAT